MRAKIEDALLRSLTCGKDRLFIQSCMLVRADRRVKRHLDKHGLAKKTRPSYLSELGAHLPACADC